ncbi:hypothetical protein, partial [Pseudomonas asplenii]|uniref:hypothetical protein n=1 Tax=Pseudomonas asplenii TaxID=53407 RepID=UPI0018DEE2C0
MKLTLDYIHGKGIAVNNLVKDIFGQAGEVYPPIIQDLLECSYNKKYKFLNLDDFKLLSGSDSNYVYWIEILYRSHWAATSNLIRHDRWYELCYNSSIISPNYIAFCSGLRGLLECATDTYDALGGVPLTLAQASSYIEDALLRRPISKILFSEELEDRLIHFSYARKLNKQENAPKSHEAKTASYYIAQLDSVDLPLKNLYAELCQVVHPAYQSTAWLVGSEDQSYKIQKPDDLAFIL